MGHANKTDAIEQFLSESQEKDLDTSAWLAEAAGLIADAEQTFRRLAEPATQK